MLCLQADNCHSLGGSEPSEQGSDVPHLFCPRSAPGASFRNARIPMTLSAYGKGTLNECTNRNHQEVRDRL